MVEMVQAALREVDLSPEQATAFKAVLSRQARGADCFVINLLWVLLASSSAGICLYPPGLWSGVGYHHATPYKTVTLKSLGHPAAGLFCWA